MLDSSGLINTEKEPRRYSYINLMNIIIRKGGGE